VVGDLTYYFRAFGLNSAGVSYGEQVLASTSSALPVVVTADILEINTNSCRSGGSIISTGGLDIIEKGICWSTYPSPTIIDAKTIGGNGVESFRCLTDTLNPNQTYHLRAFATNSARTGYGQDIEFTTLADLPRVITTGVFWIGIDSASCGGFNTYSGGDNLTKFGICWSNIYNPTIDDNICEAGTMIDKFTCKLTNLSNNRTYHVRAYATNQVGTAYGENVTFSTLEGGKFIDLRDSMEYGWVKIGGQSWMSENLAYLPSVNKAGDGSIIEKRYYVSEFYGDNITEAKRWERYRTYGVLYNWVASLDGSTASSSLPSGVKGICPDGWHLPSQTEWQLLIDYLTPESGRKLAAGYRWQASSSTYNNNLSGFSAFPCGRRRDYDGAFVDVGLYAFFQCSDESSPNSGLILGLYAQIDSEPTFFGYEKATGASVRCLKNK
jgi:uncharacterized protein (TIGR02145 family)